jgi:ABC-type amino acid transport substrate-binding protein
MIKLILIIKLLLILNLTTSLYAVEILKFSVTTGTKETRLVMGSEAILKKIGKKIGVSFVLEVLPGKRADKYLEKSLIDGDIGRILEFGQIYPHLIRIEEPIASFPYYAYAAKHEIKIKKWLDLKPYSVVYVAGTTYIEANLKPIHNKLHTIGSIKQAVRFIAAKRADIFVSSPLEMEEFQKSGELRMLGINKSQTPISTLNFYTYFQPKHALIAKKYNLALKQLKMDGTYMKILQQTK